MPFCWRSRLVDCAEQNESDSVTHNSSKNLIINFFLSLTFRQRGLTQVASEAIQEASEKERKRSGQKDGRLWLKTMKRHETA